MKMMKPIRIDNTKSYFSYPCAGKRYQIVVKAKAGNVSAAYQMPLQCDSFGDRKLILLGHLVFGALSKSRAHNVSFVLFSRLKY